MSASVASASGYDGNLTRGYTQGPKNKMGQNANKGSCHCASSDRAEPGIKNFQAVPVRVAR